MVIILVVNENELKLSLRAVCVKFYENWESGGWVNTDSLIVGFLKRT
jgi:hypothetical protein